MTRVFWYLMSPYTQYPFGKARAVMDASEHAHMAMRAGLNVFAPVPHSEAIHAIDPGALSWDQWLECDLAILEGAAGGIRLELMGYESSKGMMVEERELRRIGRQVIGWTAWQPVPEELLLANRLLVASRKAPRAL